MILFLEQTFHRHKSLCLPQLLGMIAHSAPWYKWHNILQTLTVFYKTQNKQKKVHSSLLFSDGFVVIEMCECVFVSVLIVKVAKDYFLNACIEWEQINVRKVYYSISKTWSVEQGGLKAEGGLGSLLVSFVPIRFIFILVLLSALQFNCYNNF